MTKELTEQDKQNLLEEYRDKWIKIAMSIDNNRDEDKIISLINQAYEKVNQPHPEYVLFVRSPIEAIIASDLLTKFFEKDQDTNLAQLDISKIKEIEDKYVETILSISKKPFLKTISYVLDEIMSHIKPNYVLMKAFTEILNDDFKVNEDILNHFNYGNHDAGYLSYYDFWNATHEESEKVHNLMPLIEVSEHIGWYLSYDKACIVCDKPNEININNRYRLHNDKGKAVSYNDGFCLYMLNGIRVTEKIVMAPETLTTEEIDNEANLELRRIMIDRYGMAKYLIDSGAKLIDTNPRNGDELYIKEQKDDDPIVMVKVTNSTPEPDGTYKKYFLAVHHELRPMTLVNPEEPNEDEHEYELGEPQELTAHNAVASTFGEKGEDYHPDIET